MFVMCCIIMLDFPIVYVLLKMWLNVLYINDFICHYVISTCVIQTFREAKTFSGFK